MTRTHAPSQSYPSASGATQAKGPAATARPADLLSAQPQVQRAEKSDWPELLDKDPRQSTPRRWQPLAKTAAPPVPPPAKSPVVQADSEGSSKSPSEIHDAARIGTSG